MGRVETQSVRYAIVSDIHANRQAWGAVLTDILAQRADTILCLGDVVGYGPSPIEVLESVHENCQAIVLGNHDAVVGGLFEPDIFNENARRIIEWTRDQLGKEAAQYFSRMPREMDGEGFIAAHSEIVEPERFNYVEDEQEARANFAFSKFALLFVGHTHKSGIFILDPASDTVRWYNATDFTLRDDRRYIVNVGSVGDPRDPDVRATYVLYDSERRTVAYQKVPFDVLTYRVDLQRSGLSIKPYFLMTLETRVEEDRKPAGDWAVQVQRPVAAPPHEPVVVHVDATTQTAESGTAQIAQRLANSETIRRLHERRQAELEARKKTEEAARAQEEAARKAAESEALRRRQELARAVAAREEDRRRRETDQREILRRALEAKRKAFAAKQQKPPDSDSASPPPVEPPASTPPAPADQPTPLPPPIALKPRLAVPRVTVVPALMPAPEPSVTAPPDAGRTPIAAPIEQPAAAPPAASAEAAALLSEEEARRRAEEAQRRKLDIARELAQKAATKQAERFAAREAERERVRQMLEMKRKAAAQRRTAGTDSVTDSEQKAGSGT
jgi:predicted phosphodiesterase